MKKFVVCMVLASAFVGCTSQQSKTHDSSKVVAVNIDDALLGTWDQVSLSCSQGELTKEGKEAAVSFKSGIAVAKAVVTSDKVFWDMKEYKNSENSNDFCQVSIEEKWETQDSDILTVTDSEAIVTGNGSVVCDKSYKYTQARKHKYKVSEKELSIHLSSVRDALTGVSASDKALCKTGEVVLSFVRDSEDE